MSGTHEICMNTGKYLITSLVLLQSLDSKQLRFVITQSLNFKLNPKHENHKRMNLIDIQWYPTVLKLNERNDFHLGLLFQFFLRSRRLTFLPS